MKKNFKLHFEIIRNKFIEMRHGQNSSMLAMAQALGHAHDGKVTAWKKGQWPSAEDIATIHDLFGFSFRWLLTGEGEPQEDEAAKKPEKNQEELKKAKTALKAVNAKLEVMQAKLEATEAKLKVTEAKLDTANSELRDERRLNRQLTAKLFTDNATDEKSEDAASLPADGQTDEKYSANTARAVGQK